MAVHPWFSVHHSKHISSAGEHPRVTVLIIRQTSIDVITPYSHSFVKLVFYFVWNWKSAGASLWCSIFFYFNKRCIGFVFEKYLISILCTDSAQKRTDFLTKYLDNLQCSWDSLLGYIWLFTTQTQDWSGIQFATERRQTNFMRYFAFLFPKRI